SMHVPLAWPDGADGGRGGDVILEVDASTTTLLAYHHRPHQRATGGGFSKGDLRHGARGEDLVLPVPDGTVVTGADGTVLADLVGIGTRFVAARGGSGGLGNAALANAATPAPRTRPSLRADPLARDALEPPPGGVPHRARADTTLAHDVHPVPGSSPLLLKQDAPMLPLAQTRAGDHPGNEPGE